MATRDLWNSRTGFLLATIGAAVGLGNIWRFPYIAYRNGGGAFLIPYIVAILLVGLPLVILEQGLGQKFRGPATYSFGKIKKTFEIVGWVCAVTLSLGLQIYYAVVISWCLNYFKFATDMSWGETPSKFFYGDFLNLSSSPTLALGTLQWPIVVGLAIVWGYCWWILTRGISHGIEMINKIAMPMLVILIVALVGWSLTLEGAGSGVLAYLTPNFSKLTDINIWSDAVGQIFFSLSLAFGLMTAYASYLPKDSPTVSNSKIIVLSNSCFELFAGFAVFATLGFMATKSGLPIGEIAKGGPGLAFETYPTMINQLPYGGALFGSIFFLLLVIAGLSSTISIIETLITSLIHKFGWKRSNVVSSITLLGFFLGLIFTSQSGLFYLDILDYFVTHFGLIIVALLEALLIGWFLGVDKFFKTTKIKLSRPEKSIWRFSIVIFIPLALAYMLFDDVTSLMEKPYEGYPWEMLNWIGLGWIVTSFFVSLIFYKMKVGPKSREAELNILAGIKRA